MAKKGNRKMEDVTPKVHTEEEMASLMFINVNNKRELFVVPQEYPYKQSSELIKDEHAEEVTYTDMVYPILPKMVKTPRRTLVPFISMSSEDKDLSFNNRIDIQIQDNVENVLKGHTKDLDSLFQDGSPFLSQDFWKQRRHYLFARQWKRNALNEWLLKLYQTKYNVPKDLPLLENTRLQVKNNTTAKKFINNIRNDPKNNVVCVNDVTVRDWINVGPSYSKTLSDVLGRYHEFLYKKQQSNAETKRKVAATSRYFFEILAEAKECERKMHERELVTEERLYGRKDFIADMERENQINKNRCKRLYSLYLNCQRKTQVRAANASVYVGATPSREAQVTAVAAGMAENINNADPSFEINQCNTTAGPAQGTQGTDPSPRENNPRNSVRDDNTSSKIEARSFSVGFRSSGTRSSIENATMPQKSSNADASSQNRDRPTNRNSTSTPISLSRMENLRGGEIRVVSSCLTPKNRVRMVTPTRTLSRTATNESRIVAEDGSTGTTEGSRRGAINIVRSRSDGNGNIEIEMPMSNRLSSVGGVNKWIYSKMEERGELDGYRILLNELNSLLFSNGGMIMGHSSLPRALMWLDETDSHRSTVPPSQENFRDGTLYTTCSFVEIKLMKVLQGGICALRSRPRSLEFDTAVLQQILEVNNELLELKKRLDNGRCALYKKLKRDWAERNSKWAGFPPLKRGYRLLNMLGKGGFAEVWEVLDPITLTVQAAKLHILSHDMNSVERGNVVMRVKNEIDIHKTCRTHKNIVNMKACFEMGDNMLATILELCDDGDLDHYIKLHAPVPEKLALTWTYQILEGLHYMKTLPEGRVHHCDLKPGNILKHKGDIKLADFGLSKMVPHQSTMELWAGGGTILYQPPECLLANFRSHQVVLTDKIDIWAVGCILYEMLYNTRPFGFVGGRRSLSERMYQAILGGVKFPENDKVSDDCKDLILKFLTFDPSLRPSIEDAMSNPIFRS